jgi:hypothetical protein
MSSQSRALASSFGVLATVSMALPLSAQANERFEPRAESLPSPIPEFSDSLRD